jgi:hypothetical protein
MPRRVDRWLILALFLLAGFGVLGVSNGFGDMDNAGTNGQRLAATCGMAYGVLGLLAIPALLTGWRGLRLILRLWLITVTLTGGLAPIVWGGAGVGAGIAGAILAAVIALAVVWVVRRAQVAS